MGVILFCVVWYFIGFFGILLSMKLVSPVSYGDLIVCLMLGILGPLAAGIAFTAALGMTNKRFLQKRFW
jgi:hypothetical protein